MCELWDVYNKEKLALGKTVIRGNDCLPGEYHLVVLSIIVNSDFKLLMTKRSKEKKLPGKWETTAGSVIAGETSIDGMKRELNEEIGINIEVKMEDLIHSFIYEDGIFDVYYFIKDIELENTKLQETEVDEIKYVKYDEFSEMYKKNEIVENLSVIFELKKQGIITFG